MKFNITLLVKSLMIKQTMVEVRTTGGITTEEETITVEAIAMV